MYAQCKGQTICTCGTCADLSNNTIIIASIALEQSQGEIELSVDAYSPHVGCSCQGWDDWI